MNPFEYMQAMAELWGRSGKGLAAAQQDMFHGMADYMRKATGSDGAAAPMAANTFDPQGLVRANETFSKLWSSALEMSQGRDPQRAARGRTPTLS